jgi:hypothetical protein
MTATLTTAAAKPGDGAHRRRQWRAAMIEEARRTLFRGRALGLWVLAALPPGLAALRLLVVLAQGETDSVPGITVAFAGVFQGLILLFVTFFGGLSVFSGLVRRPVLERTLHFHLLLPLPRHELLLARYGGAVVALAPLLMATTAATFVLSYLPAGPAALSRFLTAGPGLGHLARYLVVEALAVVAYGAIFLAFGLLFKRPAVPAFALFGWEIGNFLLPPLLKRFSVMRYLTSLSPVPLDEGPFAVLADSPGAVSSVLGLLLLAVAMLALAGLKFRRTEVLYGED